MSDIFVSYKKEDAGRVVRLVEALRAEGFSVWWDHGIAPGAQWDETIKTQLNAAKVVVSVWSKLSVDAPWVKEEAGVGKQRGILLPVTIDDVSPPLGFSLIQAANLVGWDGDVKDARWVHFREALKAVLAGRTPVGLEAPRRKKGGLLPWILAAGGIVAAVLAVFAYIAWDTGREYRLHAEVSRGDSTYTIEAGSGPSDARPAGGAPGAPSAQETAFWDKAMAEKTRQNFQTYLLSYPNGFYAQRARDVLLTCRQEQREVWKAPALPAGQMIRAGSDRSDYPTQAAACAAAKKESAAQFKRTCDAFGANPGSRNPQLTIKEAPCDCKQNPSGWFCFTDASYSCTWEMKSVDYVDVCG